MGALPFRKSGGGFLNNVSGTIVSTTLDSTNWDGKAGKDGYTTFSLELGIRPDGAGEPVSQFLQGGFLHEEETISADGSSIEAEHDKALVDESSELGKFLQSVADAGFDEQALIDSNFRTFSFLDNQRFTFKRVVDEEATKKFGKRKGKGKDGKPAEYMRDNLLVAEYLGEAEVVKRGKASKSAPASKAAKGGKANGAAKNAEVDAAIEQAEGVLLEIVADGAVNRAALSSKVVRYAVDNGLDTETREAIRKLVGSEDFLSRQNGWAYDAKSKGQPVTLA